MKLGFEQFKLIKPKDAQDDYTAGEDARGSTHASNIEKGKVYRKQIVSLIRKQGSSTVSALSSELDIKLKVAYSIVQKLNRQGAIEKAGKVKSKGSKPRFTYRAVN